jgi:hypothetical protein
MVPVLLLLLKHFVLISYQSISVGDIAGIFIISCFVRDRDVAISTYFSSRTRRLLHRIIRIASQHPVAALRGAIARSRSRPTRHRIRATAVPALQDFVKILHIGQSPGSTEPGAQQLTLCGRHPPVYKHIVDMNSGGRNPHPHCGLPTKVSCSS